MNISFIGYGNMAKAIARRLITQGGYSLSAAAPSLTIGTNKENIRTHYDNKEIINDAEIIILAVKPAQMGSALKEIASHIPATCLLISIAAGLRLSWFASYCKKDQALIRAIPNTPAAIGLSATPMIANKATSQEQKQLAELIFSQIGLTTWVTNESQIDSFTALSGSGPAYVFSFMDAMVNAAIDLGLDESIAKTFTFQTVKGALKLAENSDLSLTELRTQVTSPGGTTAAALSVLNKQLDKLIMTAMHAAKQRSQELGQMY